MELRAIACVEAQLGEPLREDGPILGIEFDPLPPDAFGAPLGIVNVLSTWSYYLSLAVLEHVTFLWFILMLSFVYDHDDVFPFLCFVFTFY
jgi:hypothetical protein